MAMDFSQIGKTLADPFVVFWNSLVLYLPGIIGAIILLIFGYFIASLIGLIVRKIINKTKLDEYLIKVKFERPEVLGGVRFSNIASKLIKWWVFVLFLTPAAGFLKFEKLADTITKVALWAPHLIVAILLIVVGLIAAEFLANIATSAKKFKSTKIISRIIKIVTILFFANMALSEIGVNIVLAETTFLMIIGGFIAIFVIGFGVGLIKPARDLIEDWIKKYN